MKKAYSLKKKLVLLALIVVGVRILTEIPLPWINTAVFREVVNKNAGLGLFDSLTGGGFSNFSVLSLSITPYITASIILQLMEPCIPKLAEIKQDGESGQKYMFKITLIFTGILAFSESLLMAWKCWTDGYFRNGSVFYIILTALFCTFGSVSLSAIGEWMTKHLIGNGSSVILAANIISRMPGDLHDIIAFYIKGKKTAIAILNSALAIIFIAAVIAFVVILDNAVRNIPVTHSSKISGKYYNGSMDKLPIKVNVAGVAPVIFAATLFSVPTVILQFTGNETVHMVFGIFNTSFWFRKPFYNTLGAVLYIICILAFSWYYGKMIFNPAKVAMDLKSQGAVVRGKRPGKDTSDYLTEKLKSMILLGSICISFIAVLPAIVSSLLNLSHLSFLGTSVIIVVNVLSDLATRIKAERMTDTYGNKKYFGSHA